MSCHVWKKWNKVTKELRTSTCPLPWKCACQTERSTIVARRPHSFIVRLRKTTEMDLKINSYFLAFLVSGLSVSPYFSLDVFALPRAQLDCVATTANRPWQDADSGSADGCETLLACCLFFFSSFLPQGRRPSHTFSFFCVCANQISPALLWIPESLLCIWEICAIVFAGFHTACKLPRNVHGTRPATRTKPVAESAALQASCHKTAPTEFLYFVPSEAQLEKTKTKTKLAGVSHYSWPPRGSNRKSLHW